MIWFTPLQGLLPLRVVIFLEVSKLFKLIRKERLNE